MSQWRLSNIISEWIKDCWLNLHVMYIVWRNLQTRTVLARVAGVRGRMGRNLAARPRTKSPRLSQSPFLVVSRETSTRDISLAVARFASVPRARRLTVLSQPSIPVYLFIYLLFSYKTESTPFCKPYWQTTNEKIITAFYYFKNTTMRNLGWETLENLCHLAKFVVRSNACPTLCCL